MFADLHNHTTASDGEYTPEGIIAAARDLGTRFVAISDHDTLEGVLSLPPSTLFRSAEGECAVIPATEVTLRFSEEHDGCTGTCHCLVYVPPELMESAEFVRDARQTLEQARGSSLVKARADKLNACYFGEDATVEPLLKRKVTAEEVEALPGVVTRKHFFTVLTKNHGIDPLKARAMMANDSPAYVPSGTTCEELRPFFERYPSLVKVLAHPGAGSAKGPEMALYRECLLPVETVERLVPSIDATIKLDGLEVFYPAHDEELRNRVLGMLRERDFIVTGGSDCHDHINRPLAKGGIDERRFDALRSKLFGSH